MTPARSVLCETESNIITFRHSPGVHWYNDKLFDDSKLIYAVETTEIVRAHMTTKSLPGLCPTVPDCFFNKKPDSALLRLIVVKKKKNRLGDSYLCFCIDSERFTDWRESRSRIEYTMYRIRNRRLIGESVTNLLTLEPARSQCTVYTTSLIL